MLYTIKINWKNVDGDRYVEWCNEHWYRSTSAKLCLFEYDKAMQIIEWLKSHYVYDVTLIGSDGSEKRYCCLKSHKPVAIVTSDDDEDDDWCL